MNFSTKKLHDSDNLNEITSRLKGVVKRSNGGYLAFCPSHNDQKGRSLAVSLGRQDQVLMHCFAGCSVHEITQAIGLNPADLFPRTECKYEPQARSYFNDWQIIHALQRDALIVLIAARTMLTGKALPEEDVSCLSNAVIRINDAASYSRRFQ
ncbi:hypothetical protein [Nitrosomonas sp.]|uniref:hypothetical protein n=1 Tax=Nitrosomonas sp. TaxID=42353 RepID=UPI001DDFCE2C|nr:hypothetical protein [Nitrosomonas sp.]MBX3616985.1 hypothetical protein [Nitrosomonas sp.]